MLINHIILNICIYFCSETVLHQDTAQDDRGSRRRERRAEVHSRRGPAAQGVVVQGERDAAGRAVDAARQRGAPDRARLARGQGRVHLRGREPCRVHQGFHGACRPL